jgi:hypothetical protein
VKYGNLMTDILAKEKLHNPIEYTYFKDAEKYSWEKEFRISLSALGIYEKYTFSNNTSFTFSESLHLDFSYKSAIEKNVILSINLSEQRDKNFITKLKTFWNKKNRYFTSST